MFAVNKVQYYLGNVEGKKRWCFLVDVSQSVTSPNGSDDEKQKG